MPMKSAPPMEQAARRTLYLACWSLCPSSTRHTQAQRLSNPSPPGAHDSEASFLPKPWGQVQGIPGPRAWAGLLGQHTTHCTQRPILLGRHPSRAADLQTQPHMDVYTHTHGYTWSYMQSASSHTQAYTEIRSIIHVVSTLLANQTIPPNPR